MPKPKIAIVGAGFAGLSAAYYACSHGDVTVIDSHGIGAGASGVSAGLLHCYAGRHAKLNWQGREALAAAKELISQVESATGRVVSQKNGFLRVALDQEQQEDFFRSAEKYDDLQWLTAEECQKLIPGVVAAPGIFISSGWTVDAGAYMNALWQVCQKRGAHFDSANIVDIKQLDSYDRIIIAAGSGTTAITGLDHLPLRFLKGQLLKYEWPQALPALPYPVNGGVYVVMDNDNKSCWVGSTFEKTFIDGAPDMEVAFNHIHPKLAALFPAMADLKPIDCQSGIRCTAPNHLPYVKSIDQRIQVCTGLGSKGLLYHALLGKNL